MNLTEHPKQSSKDPLRRTGDDKVSIKGGTPIVPPPMATIKDDDERLLARIGYKQVCFEPSNRVPPIAHSQAVANV